MENGKINGWKNVIIGILSTAVILAATGWMTVGKDAVGRAEVEQIVEKQSPYLEDRQTVRGLQGTVEDLTEAVTELREAVAVLNARLGP